MPESLTPEELVELVKRLRHTALIGASSEMGDGYLTDQEVADIRQAAVIVAGVAVYGAGEALRRMVDEHLWDDEVTTTTDNQYWVINGTALLKALRQAAAGDHPDVIMLELFGNSRRDGEEPE